MPWLRRARALAGLLAVVTLLGLFVADFAYSATLDAGRVRILLALIAALLGLDKLGESLPLSVEVSNEQGDGSSEDDEGEDKTEK